MDALALGAQHLQKLSCIYGTVKLRILTQSFLEFDLRLLATS